MKKTHVRVKPGEGLIVRFPNGAKSILPKEGATVPWAGPDGTYWRRRLSCGDVTLVPDVEENTTSIPTAEEIEDAESSPMSDQSKKKRSISNDF